MLLIREGRNRYEQRASDVRAAPANGDRPARVVMTFRRFGTGTRRKSEFLFELTHKELVSIQRRWAAVRREAKQRRREPRAAA